MYHIIPRNNYISVYPIEVDTKKEETRAFILPTEMEEVSPYTVVRVLDDSNNLYSQGTLLLIPTQVLENSADRFANCFFRYFKLYNRYTYANGGLNLVYNCKRILNP